MTTLVSALRPGIAHESRAPAVAMNGVSVAYRLGPSARADGRAEQPALDDITFAVPVGQRVAVVGPNGAGKSTLFKLIVGTMRPDQGGVDIYGHGPGRHICVAYVPQRNQIDWSFPVTVADVVMMGRTGRIGLLRWPRRRDWEIVRWSLARVNASHLARQQIGALSGGQQQRVFIARALAQEAELLLLDEPMAGLDLPSQEAIFNILESLRPEGVTVLVATHDLNTAADQFDQILLLNRTVVAFGRPDTVLTTENLLRAYGGHLHQVRNGETSLLLADTSGDHGE